MAGNVAVHTLPYLRYSCLDRATLCDHGICLVVLCLWLTTCQQFDCFTRQYHRFPAGYSGYLIYTPKSLFPVRKCALYTHSGYLIYTPKRALYTYSGYLIYTPKSLFPVRKGALHLQCTSLDLPDHYAKWYPIQPSKFLTIPCTNRRRIRMWQYPLC